MIRYAFRIDAVGSKFLYCVFAVKCEEVFAHTWELREGEYRVRILAPKKYEGEIWYSHFLYDTSALARYALIDNIKAVMTEEAKKNNRDFNEGEFLRSIASITTIEWENYNAS